MKSKMIIMVCILFLSITCIGLMNAISMDENQEDVRPPFDNCFVDIEAKCKDGTSTTSSGSACVDAIANTLADFGAPGSSCMDKAEEDAWLDVKSVCDSHGGLDLGSITYHNAETRRVNDC